MTRDPTAGVTLIEMVVALAIFALIGGAGYSMLDQVLRIDAGTSGRLDRLGDMQRALFLVGQDFAQAGGHSVRQDDGLNLTRDGVVIRYRLAGDGLRRDLRDAGESVAEQVLVEGVQGLQWRFLNGGQWGADLPAGAGRPRNPRAVEVVLTLTGGQQVRQAAVLPAEAD